MRVTTTWTTWRKGGKVRNANSATEPAMTWLPSSQEQTCFLVNPRFVANETVCRALSVARFSTQTAALYSLASLVLTPLVAMQGESVHSKDSQTLCAVPNQVDR